MNELRSIPDDELLRRLATLLQKSRRVESELVAHIGEVDARRLYAREACSSMFTYCTEVLRLSEAEAYLRLGAARASRKFPSILLMLADGRLHLSGIAKLAPHLTEANCETLLARAAHRSKRQIEELVAELSPKADVPSVIRKLPTPKKPIQVAALVAELRPDAVKFEMPSKAIPAVVKPLAPARYKIQFTASASLRDKLDRLKGLMRASVPDGDLGVIIEQAVTEKLDRLESRRFAATKSARKTLEAVDTSPTSRYIPAPVKRAVCERDGDRCAFVDARGRRCTERQGVEFHHRHPFGLGGSHRPENLELMCAAHNRYLAERDYGKTWMLRYRRDAGRVREPSPVYG